MRIAAVRLVLCVCLGVATTLAACGRGAQDIDIAAQDFRLTPNEIRLSANRPARLVIRNEGREQHKMASPLLDRASLRMPQHDASAADAARTGIGLLPGQVLELQFRPEPGVYEIRCLIKGHTGMRGLVIVEG